LLHHLDGRSRQDDGAGRIDGDCVARHTDNGDHQCGTTYSEN